MALFLKIEVSATSQSINWWPFHCLFVISFDFFIHQTDLKESMCILIRTHLDSLESWAKNSKAQEKKTNFESQWITRSGVFKVQRTITSKQFKRAPDSDCDKPCTRLQHLHTCWNVLRKVTSVRDFFFDMYCNVQKAVVLVSKTLGALGDHQVSIKTECIPRHFRLICAQGCVFASGSGERTLEP